MEDYSTVFTIWTDCRKTNPTVLHIIIILPGKSSEFLQPEAAYKPPRQSPGWGGSWGWGWKAGAGRGCLGEDLNTSKVNREIHRYRRTERENKICARTCWMQNALLSFPLYFQWNFELWTLTMTLKSLKMRWVSLHAFIEGGASAWYTLRGFWKRHFPLPACLLSPNGKRSLKGNHASVGPLEKDCSVC